MTCITRKERQRIVLHLEKWLSRNKPRWEVPAMAFLVEVSLMASGACLSCLSPRHPLVAAAVGRAQPVELGRGWAPVHPLGTCCQSDTCLQFFVPPLSEVSLCNCSSEAGVSQAAGGWEERSNTVPHTGQGAQGLCTSAAAFGLSCLRWCLIRALVDVSSPPWCGVSCWPFPPFTDAYFSDAGL